MVRSDGTEVRIGISTTRVQMEFRRRSNSRVSNAFDTTS